MNIKKQKFRRVASKILAPIIAFFTLFVLLLGPMYIFRVVSGIPLDAKGPEGEGWLLILGSCLGGGCGYLTFYYIHTKLGGFDDTDINKMWHGRKK